MRLALLLTLVTTVSAVFAQTARLQVIHNSPSPTVDVYLNGGLLLDSFVYRTATPFIDAPADAPITIDIAPHPSTGPGDAIFTATPTLTSGETYVAVASGIVGDLTTPFDLWVQDGIREASTGSDVEFIVVHGSTDAPTVDVIARDVAVLVDDASYGDFTGYIGVPAGAYTLDVTPGDYIYTTVNSWAADLSGLGGGSAVVFASGFLSGATPAFGLFAALADGTVVEFPEVPQETTTLQVIHNSPSPIVDVYVNGTLTIDNFAFRTATPFVPVPALVPVRIDIAPETSTSAADAIYTETGVFRRSDRNYVCIASGIVGDTITPFDLVFQGNIRTSNPFGEVQFIAFHGSPDAPAVDIVADGALTLFDDVAFGDISRYTQVPAASYTIDINTADGLTTVVSFTADLSGLAGGNAVVFASGFLAAGPPDFGLYAALTDGTVIAFPTVSPRLAGEVTVEGIFPTIADSEIRVNLTGTANDQVGIMVFSSNGQLVKTDAVSVDAGRIIHSMDVSDLPTGNYFLTVMTQEGPQTQSFVKQ